jgi:hypothetical protein
MMTNKEIEMFADAYQRNMAYASREEVIKFVTLHNLGETPEYSGDTISIMDALGMWFAGSRYALQQISEVL